MTESWEGFTPEEISKISNLKQPIVNSDIIQSNSPVRKMTFKKNKFGKKNITRERMLKSNKLEPVTDGQAGLPSGACLFIPQVLKTTEHVHTRSIKKYQYQYPTQSSAACNIDENSFIRTAKIPEEDEVEQLETSLPPVEPETSNKPTSSLPEPLTSPCEGSLEEFEKRQKLIQEQNKLRKELLKKALEDRTKKTKEEARRLGQIEEELKKLDVQLSNDVSILRNQIEVASLEFMEAQKRFDRAEREYLDAKLALFTKRERKELLTGHLCTIIEQNELRKAKKLSNLMDKLQLGSVIIEKPFEVPENITNSDNKDDKKTVTSEAPT